MSNINVTTTRSRRLLGNLWYTQAHNRLTGSRSFIGFGLNQVEARAQRWATKKN